VTRAASVPVTRRTLLLTLSAGAVCAGGGLGPHRQASATAPTGPGWGPWLAIENDGTATLLHSVTDLGQGTPTALAQVLADQLHLPLSAVVLRQAPVRAPFVENDGYYGTAASAGLSGSFAEIAQLGATARAMLMAAAARRWHADLAACDTQPARVVHRPTGRTLGYGELSAEAGALPVPALQQLALRPYDPNSWVGKPALRVIDRELVTGHAAFGIDVKLEGLVSASLRHAPVLGSRLRSLDPAPALRASGVLAVLNLGDAIAVVAADHWAASQALAKLAPVWDHPPGAIGSKDLRNQMLRAVHGDAGLLATLPDGGEPDVHRAQVLQELARAPNTVQALYEAPMAAHMAMEPQNATARVSQGQAEIWVSTQAQSLTREKVAEALALPLEQVTVHTLRVGGGFGRRLECDAAVQAARISRAVGRPVKLIWSREEDVRHDFMRPPAMGRLRAALGPDGQMRALAIDLAGPSLMASSSNRHPLSEDGIDFTVLMGLRGPYEGPVASRRWTRVEGGMRSGWWRSVGACANTFFLESFLDELAHATQADPVQTRLRLLRAPPARTVLEALVQRADLAQPVAPGRSRGLALGGHAGATLAGLSVEIVASAARGLRLARVVVVVNCGRVVNPRLVRSQVEGSVAWAVSACLLGEITATAGSIDQSGFHDYPVIGMAQMPAVELHLMDSDADPSGIGEEVVPLVAPALANAIFAASGERVRALPLSRSGWHLA
jgi:isoquinoline 1-oxidoreductase beta subunit